MTRSRGRNPGGVLGAGTKPVRPTAPETPILIARSNPLVIAGLLIALAGVVVAVHWPVLSAQARSFDDHEFLFENHLVRNPSWDSAARFFGEVLEPSTVQGYYIPLTMVSLMLDYAASGSADDLRPYHRTSLALHVANCLLLTVILYQLFGSPWAATIAALLFGVHPLTVEPVAWLAERKTVLSAFFALLCLVLYLRYARRGERVALAGSAAAYALSLLAKPTGLLLPVVLILLDAWPLRRTSRRTLLEKWPFYLVAVASAAVTLVSHARTASVRTPAEHLFQVPLAMAYLVTFYLRKVVWPVNLSSVYPMPEPLTLADPAVAVSPVATVVLIAALWWCGRRFPAPLAGFMIFLVVILPTLGLIRYSWVRASDKYVYLPAIGLVLPLAWAIAQFLNPPKGRPLFRLGLLALPVTAVAALEAVATRSYLHLWRDSEALARHMVEVAPRSPYALSVLASALAGQGRTAEAIAGYRRALELDPDHADAHYNLAVALAEQGEIDEAIEHYRAVLRQRPRSVRAHNNLANLLARRGRAEEAAAHYEAALELAPDAPETHYNFANLLWAVGRADLAVPHYQAAAELAPGRPETWNNLGMALARVGDLRAAITAYRESIRLKPDEASTWYNLANALSNLGSAAEAVEAYQRALELQPEYASAHNNLANALLRLDRRDEAITHFREALRIEPGHTRARLNLARTLEEAGRRDEAIAEYEALLRLQPDHLQARERLEALTGRPAVPPTPSAPVSQPAA